MDTLAGQTFCRLDKNTALQNKSNELEQGLRQIMKTTFKIFFDLVGKLLIFLMLLIHLMDRSKCIYGTILSFGNCYSIFRYILKCLIFTFFFPLKAMNQPDSNLLDTFGVLESLSVGNLSDPRFIRLWYSLKMVPLLPHVDAKFLMQLGNQNFSCRTFQEL